MTDGWSEIKRMITLLTSQGIVILIVICSSIRFQGVFFPVDQKCMEHKTVKLVFTLQSAVRSECRLFI